MVRAKLVQNFHEKHVGKRFDKHLPGFATQRAIESKKQAPFLYVNRGSGFLISSDSTKSVFS